MEEKDMDVITIVGLALVILSTIALFILMIYFFYTYPGTQVSVSWGFWAALIVFGVLLLVGFVMGLYGAYRRRKIVPLGADGKVVVPVGVKVIKVRE